MNDPKGTLNGGGLLIQRMLVDWLRTRGRQGQK